MAGPEKHPLLVLLSVQTPDQGRKGREPLDSAAPGSCFRRAAIFCDGPPNLPVISKGWDAEGSSLLSVFTPPSMLHQATRQPPWLSAPPPSCWSHLPLASSAIPWTPHLCIQLPPHHLPYTYPRWPAIFVPNFDFPMLTSSHSVVTPLFHLPRPHAIRSSLSLLFLSPALASKFLPS